LAVFKIDGEFELLRLLAGDISWLDSSEHLIGVCTTNAASPAINARSVTFIRAPPHGAALSEMPHSV
jgi:hypothetical protein